MRKEFILYGATTIVALILSYIFKLPKIAYLLSFVSYPLLRYYLGVPIGLTNDTLKLTQDQLGLTPNQLELTRANPLIYKGTKLFEEGLTQANPPANFLLPIVVGLDYKGKMIYADMADVLNCLVAGLQGMGKSNFLEGLIQSSMYFRPQDIIYVMADFKKLGLVDYNKFSNTVFTHDYEELGHLLDELIKIMNERISLFSNQERKAIKNIKDYPGKLPWIFIVIDEVADISSLRDSKTSDMLWDKLEELLRKGRALGIILILATQRPTATNIPGDLGALLDSRFVMRVKNANESRYCHVDGAHTLKNPGEMVVESRTVNGRFKTLKLEDSDRIYDQLLESTSKQSKASYDLVDRLSSRLRGFEEKGAEKAIIDDLFSTPQSLIEAFKTLLESGGYDYELPPNSNLKAELNLTDWQLSQLKKEAESLGILKKAGLTKYVVSGQ